MEAMIAVEHKIMQERKVLHAPKVKKKKTIKPNCKNR
jgi:hypothetical protein